ncbi:MAG: cell wall metabolism sensor histidine kinase WalK [Lachnospiraceae bacterium]|jgi:two-component system sensor histidine kinase YesM|nr:cell wall metabolism sensor histidine kinase WalK [Lachnospiraceae bacterium]
MGTKNRKLHIGHISLKEKLFILCAFLIIPFSIIIFYLLYNLNQYCSSYDSIVRNITQANEYNVAFKEDMDEVVYQMIARSMSKYEVESQLNMKNPDRMITDAEQTFESLKQNSFSPDAQDRLSSVIKLLITLRKRVNDIDSKVKISGYYDENMTSLDSDIRIITELIQERISEYIYHESESMETVRQNMSESRNILTRFSFMTIGTTLALVILLSIFISRSITEPIKRLTAVTKQVGKGDFSTRSEVNEGDDLAAPQPQFQQYGGAYRHAGGKQPEGAGEIERIGTEASAGADQSSFPVQYSRQHRMADRRRKERRSRIACYVAFAVLSDDAFRGT